MHTVTPESGREAESQHKQSAGTPESKTESRERKVSCPKEIQIERKKEQAELMPEPTEIQIQRKKEQAELMPEPTEIQIERKNEQAEPMPEPTATPESVR